MARPNKNSAEYFAHDADMRNDIKIKALRRNFGHKGYAVWCFILETLTDSEDYFADYNDISKELMAADFDISVEELQEIVSFSCRINLLQMTEDNRLYSQSLQRRFENLTVKRERKRLLSSEERREINRQNGLKGGNPNFQKDKPNPYYEISKTKSDITETLPNITEDKPKVKESKEEESKPKKSKDREIVYPYSDIARLWNEICGGKLPKVKALNDNRRQKIKCRLSESGAKTEEEMTAWAKDLFGSIAASSFLCGENNHQWSATFDWIFENATNWVKVSEGNYDNKRGSNTGRTGVQNSLGVGEYITQDGRRTYGSGRANIPLSAPPRPSEKYQWSAESQNWIML